jgi:hypothetical protein
VEPRGRWCTDKDSYSLIHPDIRTAVQILSLLQLVIRSTNNIIILPLAFLSLARWEHTQTRRGNEGSPSLVWSMTVPAAFQAIKQTHNN